MLTRGGPPEREREESARPRDERALFAEVEPDDSSSSAAAAGEADEAELLLVSAESDSPASPRSCSTRLRAAYPASICATRDSSIWHSHEQINDQQSKHQ